jgi:hypothetical protein
MSNHSHDTHEDGVSNDDGCCDDCIESSKNGKDEFGNPVSLVKEFTQETNANLIAAAAASGADGFDGNIDTGDGSAAPTRPVPPTKPQPGKWVPVPKQESVDVDTARKYIEGRPLPTNIYRPGAAPAPVPTVPGAKSLATGFAGNTVAGPASIVELSRALKSNVDLIYEWVFNNVEKPALIWNSERRIGRAY